MLRYDGGKVVDYSHSTIEEDDSIFYDNSQGFDNLIISSDRPPTIARWKSFGIDVMVGDRPWPEDIFHDGYGDPYFQTDRYSVR